MDNAKTGNYIKALRRERGLTQLELAQQLHITDRAVSKWERGLCAPDIALLEPLATVLGTTVMALLTGEPEAEVSVEQVIAFSSAEIDKKIKSARRIALLAVLASILVIALLLPIFNWISGEGFTWGCVAASYCAKKGAQALESYDEPGILRYFSASESMAGALAALETEGIVIREAQVSVASIGLEDGLLLFEMELLVARGDLAYQLNFPGTYKNGKVALMSVPVPDSQEWIGRLNDALSTYDPG